MSNPASAARTAAGPKEAAISAALLGGHPGHQFGGLLVEQGTQVLHGDAPGEDAGHILKHGLEVAVLMVEAGPDKAALLVDQAAQGLVVGKALAGP